MTESTAPVELAADGRRYARLSPRGPGPQGSVGCVFLLGVPLTLIGAGLVAFPFMAPDPLEESFVALVVGALFGLVGLLLVWGGIRGTRARSLPPPTLGLEADATPRPGATFAVRVRQPGPVAIESLRLALTCVRRYQRRVRRHSTATVDDSQLLWEKELLALRGERIAAGDRLERFVEVTLPAEVLPTGPALPDGRVCWTLELAIEAGFLRGFRTDFEIEVGAAPERGA